MSVDLIAVLIAFIGNTFLSLFTLLKNPNSATNKLFFVFTLSLTAYLWINFISTQQSTDDGAFFWVKMVMSIAVFINLFFFLLASTFPHLKLQTRPLYLWLAVISTVVLLIAAQLGLIFKNANASGEAGDPSFAMPFFLIHTALCLGGGFILLIKKSIYSKGIEKIQIQLFISGTVIMFTSIITTNLLFVLVLKTANFVWLLPLYTFTFVGFISYAIVKHRFLDIGLLVARTVSFAVLIGVSSLIYVFLSVVASSMLLNVMLEAKAIAIFTVLTLLVASSFQPLRRFLEKVTDKVFFKDKYDQSELLYNLTLIMASTLRLEDLTHQMLNELLTNVKISKGGFVLTDKGNIYDIAHAGYDEFPEIDEKKINILENIHNLLVFEELSENSIKEIMREYGFTLVIPLHAEGEDLGLLVLGEKLSGDIYSSEDIRLLEILAPEAAVAIQNAKAYEEIRRFNITLQEEVDKATKDLQNANERLQELDKLKDDFVSIASHELRTPMTAIRSYVWMALHKPDIPLSEKLKKYLYRTLISTERLISLVNDMLNVSRIEAGRIEIYPKPFNIIELVNDVIEEVRVKAEEKVVKLAVVEAKVPLVFADPDKVHQVLLNLIGNSLKFTGPNGIISVSFFTDGKMIEVAIKDTGTGISKEDLSKLFHKFSRLDNSYVAMGTSGGTGLGLYISRSLIDLMRGKIWASSEGAGKGSTFSFSLPVATQDLIDQSEKFHVKPMGDAKPLEPVAI